MELNENEANDDGQLPLNHQQIHGKLGDKAINDYLEMLEDWFD